MNQPRLDGCRRCDNNLPKAGGGIYYRAISRFTAIALLAIIAANACWATSHVFVRNADGVWLASDTLVVHSDGIQITMSHSCKVSVSRNQLLFNTGRFSDIKGLMMQEASLPFASMAETLRKVAYLLSTSHMDTRGEENYNPDHVIVSTGILQVENSVFRAKMLNQTDNLKHYINYVNEDFQPGIPHGYGDAVHEANIAAKSDVDLTARLLQNPKEELLRILREESTLRPAEVSGPFTVLLLRPDGKVSDYSDEPLCVIPENAR